MGHFNYAQSSSQVDDIVFWTQKYREWFATVIVEDGSLVLSSFTQSDFLHISTRYAEKF
jgi:hypothetical protein